MRHLFTVAFSVVALSPLAASAQDADGDWDLLRDTNKKVSVAATLFDSGLGVVVRCSNRMLEAVVVGLPDASAEEAAAESRTLAIGFRGAPPTPQRWNLANTPTAAVSNQPAIFARSLREGGQFEVGTTQNGRRLIHRVDLPPSNTAIDQVLGDCGRPLVDPRDALIANLGENGLPEDLTWSVQPRPAYPQGRTYTRGFAVLTCLTRPNGRLNDCVVETEYPGDGGFGEAALRSAQNARLQFKDSPDAPLDVRLVSYKIKFSMSGDGVETGSRLRRD